MKEDIPNIKIEMAHIKSEFKLMKWVAIPVVASFVSLLAKTFF